MIIAFLSIVSASFAEELVAGTMVFGEMERILFVMIVVVIVMFVGPVTVFAPRLKSVRLKDAGEFRSFAAEILGDAQWAYLKDAGEFRSFAARSSQ